MKFDDETKSEQYKDFNTHANVRRLSPKTSIYVIFAKSGSGSNSALSQVGNVHKQRRDGDYF